MSQCKFCKNEATVSNSQAIDSVTCPKCGTYTIRFDDHRGWELKEDFKPYVDKISSWISEQNIVFNEPFVLIDDDTMERIIAQPDKKMKEKFDCVLKALQSKPALYLKDLNYCYLTKKEFNQIFFKLEKKEFIIFTRIPTDKYHHNNIKFSATIQYDGIEYLESLEQTNKNSKNIFVAFHFTKELQTIFDTEVKAAIEALDYTYVRVSSSSTKLDTHINDDIIAKLRSAKLIIADFTGQRNSVYFEAGFAMGLNIPIIWACHKKDVKKLSFDTRQYPHIIWEDANDLSYQITKKIQALP